MEPWRDFLAVDVLDNGATEGLREALRICAAAIPGRPG
jgi:hypothetical protein